MPGIEKNQFNMNISRFISTAVTEEEIDEQATNQTLVRNLPAEALVYFMITLGLFMGGLWLDV